MTDYENLKGSYAATIQLALVANAGYHNIKIANEGIHEFCKHFVENGNYPEYEKTIMKQELEILKKTFEEEIEIRYQVR